VPSPVTAEGDQGIVFGLATAKIRGRGSIKLVDELIGQSRGLADDFASGSPLAMGIPNQRFVVFQKSLGTLKDFRASFNERPGLF
jgi:hypothetical protein